ncbi:MAG: sugar transferase [Cytophagales bacterium]
MHYKLPLWKRAFDIVFSLIAILFLSPIFIVVSTIILLSSKGPLIYRSKRVGMNYEIFDFLKFRSMRVDADKMLAALAKSHNQYKQEKQLVNDYQPALVDSEDSLLFYSDDEVYDEEKYLNSLRENNNKVFNKISNDPRVTPIGRFIRNTSIDELPQLFNVLLGDMSIVGNRPLPLYEAEKLTSDKELLRFFAPAGITGLWQVTKRGKKDMSQEERIELDNHYAQNCSLWLDIAIIFRTFKALLQKDDV